MLLLSRKAAENLRFARKLLDSYFNAQGHENQRIAKQKLLSFNITEDMFKMWENRINKGLEQCRKDTLKFPIDRSDKIQIPHPIHEMVQLETVFNELKGQDRVLQFIEDEKYDTEIMQEDLDIYDDYKEDNESNIMMVLKIDSKNNSNIDSELKSPNLDTLRQLLQPRKVAGSSFPSGTIAENMEWKYTELPFNFSWIVNGWLCGCSCPQYSMQLKAFEWMNIGLIITFLENPLSAEKRKEIDEEEIQCLHIYNRDFDTPKLKDMDRAVAAFAECVFVRNKAVLVHCMAGKGRTGTALACFLVKWGLHFDEIWESELKSQRIPKCKEIQKGATKAIKHIRKVRPGSIETDEQGGFVREYASHLRSSSNNVIKK